LQESPETRHFENGFYARPALTLGFLPRPQLLYRASESPGAEINADRLTGTSALQLNHFRFLPETVACESHEGW